MGKHKNQAARGRSGETRNNSQPQGFLEILSGLAATVKNLISDIKFIIVTFMGAIAYFRKSPSVAIFLVFALLMIVCCIFVKKHKKNGIVRFAFVACGGICFAGTGLSALAATGLIEIYPTFIEKDTKEGEENNRDLSSGQSLYTSAEERALRSTEAPDAEYDSSGNAAQPDAVSYRDRLLDAGKTAGLTGSRESFANFRSQILETADVCGQESNYAAKKLKDSSRAAKNADEADRLTNESYYDTEAGFAYAVQICELRKENYEMAPALNTAGLMGHAALDCLYFMGMVREDNKNFHMMDTSIFNKENAILYGDIAAEGFLQARSKAIRAQNYRSMEEANYGLAQLFHRLGDASEFFPVEETVVCLGIAAVFYSECSVDDEESYEDGSISSEQYSAAEYAAIVFEKMDAKLKPQDCSFLEEAEKYYTYALRNESLGEAGRKRLEGYIRTVQEKKKQKGL